MKGLAGGKSRRRPRLRQALARVVTGDDDGTVYPGNTASMAAKLREFSSPVQAIHHPGTGPVGILLSLVPGFRGGTHLRQDMLEFIHAH
jgi:hypothetical protein